MPCDESFDPLGITAKTNKKSGKRNYQFQKEDEDRHCALTVVAGSEDGVGPIHSSLKEGRKRANYENQGNCHVKAPAPDLPVTLAFPSTHGQIVLLFLAFRMH
jgi:hypothetical protein